jgi:hypothetical protein
MQIQFNLKLALMFIHSVTTKFIVSILIGLPLYAVSAQEPQKAKWYRYYDSKGVANISTNVTPNHIKHGYEALDANMQVITRARAYNVETDIKQAPQRAAQAKQQEEDIKLQRAYTNSKVATEKRNAILESAKKQMKFHQDQLKQLQNDRIGFKRQEMEHQRKGKNIPQTLKDTLDYNARNINDKKKAIQSLQLHYRKTQQDYEKIITRLVALETKK